MKMRKHIEVPQDVLDISDLFKKRNKQLFLVGGAVRDAIMGKEPKDFDLATDALPEEVISILEGNYKLLEIGKSFGVVSAVTSQFPTGIEIATFRRESYGNYNFPSFVRYIEKIKPENFEKRLHLLSELSGEKLP